MDSRGDIGEDETGCIEIGCVLLTNLLLNPSLKEVICWLDVGAINNYLTSSILHEASLHKILSLIVIAFNERREFGGNKISGGNGRYGKNALEVSRFRDRELNTKLNSVEFNVLLVNLRS